jgi:hypothetical protein
MEAGQIDVTRRGLFIGVVGKSVAKIDMSMSYRDLKKEM